MTSRLARAAAAQIGLAECVLVISPGPYMFMSSSVPSTADSGMPAQGHYLSTSPDPARSAFWTGGADGPEGSLLVLGVILLLLVALLVIYGRRSALVTEAEQLTA